MGETMVIAGATGNCGKEVVRAAHARGLRVRALVRDPARLAAVRDCVDEVRTVEVTRRDDLRGTLDGAAYLVTALGKTRQTDRVDRRAVDVDANLHLFDEAAAAGVGRVGLVSVFGADPASRVALLRMKGEAEEALRAAGLDHVIVRPTGYFSDMWTMFEMARDGTLWMVGSGETRLNPISLPDLGRFIVDRVVEGADQPLACGGPDLLTWNGIGEICGRVLGRPVKTRHVPMWMARAGVAMMRPFSRNRWEIAQFILGQVALMDGIAEDQLPPAVGTEHLEDWLRQRHQAELAAAGD